MRHTDFVTEVLRTSQLKEASQVLTSAFWTYPETLHLLPDERRRRHVLPRYLLSDAHDAVRYGTLLGAVSGGRIAGAAAWIPPEAYPISLRRQISQLLDLAPALPWGWRAAREAQRGRHLNRHYHRRHPEHFYLRAVGVDPSCQGRGFGSSLLTPILTLADQRAVGCFLQTATSENVHWYEQFGFEVADVYQPTPSWPQTWTMWRNPGS